MGIFDNRSDDLDPALDIYDRLLRERIIFVGTEISDDLANTVVAQLLFLDDEDASKDIQLYINSPGGSVVAGLAIYDTIQHVRADVTTMCMGLAAGMAGLLLTAGTKGKRFSLSTARIMLCPLLGGADTSVDIEVQAQEILRIQSIVNNLLATHTGRSSAQIAADTERDFWLSPSEAMDYGLIDRVIDQK